MNFEFDKYRLSTEKWITERNFDCQIILNYCRVRKPSPWGDRFITYKLTIGRVSELNIIINNHRYDFSPCSPIYLTPDLTWATFKTLHNGNQLQVITKSCVPRDHVNKTSPNQHPLF